MASLPEKQYLLASLHILCSLIYKMQYNTSVFPLRLLMHPSRSLAESQAHLNILVAVVLAGSGPARIFISDSSARDAWAGYILNTHLDFFETWSTVFFCKSAMESLLLWRSALTCELYHQLSILQYIDVPLQKVGNLEVLVEWVMYLPT